VIIKRLKSCLIVSILFFLGGADMALSQEGAGVGKLPPVNSAPPAPHPTQHPKHEVRVVLVSGAGLTLADCYGKALRQSETIAITAEMIKEAEARFIQALSIILPHAYFTSTNYQEEAPSQEGTGSSAAVFASQKPAKSSECSFNFTQDLFSGFKAIAAMKGAKSDRSQRVKDRQRAQQLLLADVADAFYLVIEMKADYNALMKIKYALMSRIMELRGRERLGRSRPSEVVNAKAQLYSVEADLEVSKSREVLARQILEFLIGGTFGNISDPRDIPLALQPEEYYVSLSDSRPDVIASRYAWQVAKAATAVVNSKFLPDVTLSGNYYTQRTAFDKGTDWDVKLVIDVPIFDGAETVGKSNEALAKERESELEYRRKRRKAPYDIKDAYVRYKTAVTVYEALRKEYRTAKLNYHLQKKDYLLSLVNNLDVLAAIQTLQNSQRNYIHALYEAKRQYWSLRVAIGEGITENINDII
jgi:outer membrane protein TolC